MLELLLWLQILFVLRSYRLIFHFALQVLLVLKLLLVHCNVTIHLLLVLCLHPTFFLELSLFRQRLFLFCDYLFSNPISFGVLRQKFLFCFHFLVVQNIESNLLVGFLVLSLFAGDVRPLIIEVISVFLLDRQISFFLVSFNSAIHLVLMLNNCSPFVVNHLFLRNRQMSLLWRSLEAASLRSNLQCLVRRVADFLGFISRRYIRGAVRLLHLVWRPLLALNTILLWYYLGAKLRQELFIINLV